jgi:hypothetical protein
MDQDLVKYQRLCSGYVPLQSETVGAGAAPTSSKLQNCTVIKPAGAATGVLDIIIGGTQIASAPSPVGIGGSVVAAPPLNGGLAPNELVVDQLRFRCGVRTPLTQAPSAAATHVTFSYQSGANFLAVSPYAGVSINQIVRVFITTVDAVGNIAAADRDFDFEVLRVIDPSVEP